MNPYTKFRTLPNVSTQHLPLLPLSQKPAFAPLEAKQVLVVDVYSSWSGSCLALEGYLRKQRHTFVENPNCLVLAKACCDDIAELEPFKQ